MRGDLPSGTVTFLFTDVERSTQLLHELGAYAYTGALQEHRGALRDCFGRHGGVEVDTQGDTFLVAFASGPAALAAAREAQAELQRGPVAVRMGLRTGTPHLTEEGYVGEDIHLVARIVAAGHGGQVLLSASTRERLEPCDREREVAEVTALLRNGTRLATLSGPGGSGKARLAIEAAAELVPEFKAGVFWAWRTVADLCRRLDNMPLALGLGRRRNRMTPEEAVDHARESLD